MLIKSIILKNFRGYKDEISVEFDNLTAFVGRNDAGKSTILEALEIFFNEGKGIIAIEKSDINKSSSLDGDTETIIGVEFKDLPKEVIIDADNITTLKQEYLLNDDGNLTIIKKYLNAGREKVFIRAQHPSNIECSCLLQMKQTELKAKIKELGLDCDKTKNAVMRKAIWNYYIDTLDLRTKELDANKDETKNIWDKLKAYLPVYSLFQSDRSNSDHDKEVQDPLKEAVKQILKEEEVTRKCQEIANIVTGRLCEVSGETLEKLREMNPELANNLNSQIPSPSDLKWADVFKSVSITGDNDIPINKRGSGVKRLILINFFRAQAERKQNEAQAPGIIYAIEEPETAQHVAHQLLLINALKNLSTLENTQVLITTHSSLILKQLKFENLRLINDSDDNKKITMVEPSELPYPSINEISFTAFDEISEEYHNELYSHIIDENYLGEYLQNKETKDYIRVNKNGLKITERKPLSEYIRHQIHHPENTLNAHYSKEELRQSIIDMREFINQKRQA